MSLSAADVAEIMRLVEQSSFDELTLEMDGVKLTLRKGGVPAGAGSGGTAFTSVPPSAVLGGPNPAVSNSVAPSAALANAASGASPNSAATGGEPKGSGATGPGPKSSHAIAASDPNITDIVSPLLGTFYRSPKPGAPPFVDVGSVVEENTIVAIVEVMKLMNSVRAGVRGKVTEVLVTDGSLVEFEQPLLRVRKAD